MNKIDRINLDKEYYIDGIISIENISQIDEMNAAEDCGIYKIKNNDRDVIGFLVISKTTYPSGVHLLYIGPYNITRSAIEYNIGGLNIPTDYSYDLLERFTPQENIVIKQRQYTNGVWSNWENVQEELTNKVLLIDNSLSRLDKEINGYTLLGEFYPGVIKSLKLLDNTLRPNSNGTIDVSEYWPRDGKSAYQIWLEQEGNSGKTLEEFLASLKESGFESLAIPANERPVDPDLKTIYAIPENANPSTYWTEEIYVDGSGWLVLARHTGDLSNLIDDVDKLKSATTVYTSSTALNKFIKKIYLDFEEYNELHPGSEVYPIGTELPDGVIEHDNIVIRYYLPTTSQEYPYGYFVVYKKTKPNSYFSLGQITLYHQKEVNGGMYIDYSKEDIYCQRSTGGIYYYIEVDWENMPDSTSSYFELSADAFSSVNDPRPMIVGPTESPVLNRFIKSVTVDFVDVDQNTINQHKNKLAIYSFRYNVGTDGDIINYPDGKHSIFIRREDWYRDPLKNEPGRSFLAFYASDSQTNVLQSKITLTRNGSYVPGGIIVKMVVDWDAAKDFNSGSVYTRLMPSCFNKELWDADAILISDNYTTGFSNEIALSQKGGHDLKNEINTINTNLSGSISDLQELIDSLEEGQQVLYTNNNTINSIIKKVYIDCSQYVADYQDFNSGKTAVIDKSAPLIYDDGVSTPKNVGVYLSSSYNVLSLRVVNQDNSYRSLSWHNIGIGNDIDDDTIIITGSPTVDNLASGIFVYMEIDRQKWMEYIGYGSTNYNGIFTENAFIGQDPRNGLDWTNNVIANKYIKRLFVDLSEWPTEPVQDLPTKELFLNNLYVCPIYCGESISNGRTQYSFDLRIAERYAVPDNVSTGTYKWATIPNSIIKKSQYDTVPDDDFVYTFKINNTEYKIKIYAVIDWDGLINDNKIKKTFYGKLNPCCYNRQFSFPELDNGSSSPSPAPSNNSTAVSDKLTDNDIANQVIKRFIINPKYDNRLEKLNFDKDNVYISRIYQGGPNHTGYTISNGNVVGVTCGMIIKFIDNPNTTLWCGTNSKPDEDGLLIYENNDQGVYINLILDYGKMTELGVTEDIVNKEGNTNVPIHFLKDVATREDLYDVSDIKKNMIDCAKLNFTTLRESATLKATSSKSLREVIKDAWNSTTGKLTNSLHTYGWDPDAYNNDTGTYGAYTEAALYDFVDSLYPQQEGEDGYVAPANRTFIYTLDGSKVSLGEKWNFEEETTYSNILGRVFTYLNNIDNRNTVYRIYRSENGSSDPNVSSTDPDILIKQVYGGPYVADTHEDGYNTLYYPSEFNGLNFSFDIPRSLDKCTQIKTFFDDASSSDHTQSSLSFGETVNDYELPNNTPGDTYIIDVTNQSEFDEIEKNIVNALKQRQDNPEYDPEYTSETPGYNSSDIRAQRYLNIATDIKNVIVNIHDGIYYAKKDKMTIDGLEYDWIPDYANCGAFIYLEDIDPITGYSSKNLKIIGSKNAIIVVGAKEYGDLTLPQEQRTAIDNGEYIIDNHAPFYEGGSQYSSFFYKTVENGVEKLIPIENIEDISWKPVLKLHIYAVRQDDAKNTNTTGKDIWISEGTEIHKVQNPEYDPEYTSETPGYDPDNIKAKEFISKSCRYFEFKALKEYVKEFVPDTYVDGTLTNLNSACVCIASGWGVYIKKLLAITDNNDGTVTIKIDAENRTSDIYKDNRSQLSLNGGSEGINKPYSYGIRFKIINEALSKSTIYIDDVTEKIYIPKRFGKIIECESNTFLRFGSCALKKLDITGITFMGGRRPLHHSQSNNTAIAEGNRNGIITLAGGDNNAARVSITNCNFYNCKNHCITTIYHPRQPNILIKNCHFKDDCCCIKAERHLIGLEVTNNIFENIKNTLGQSYGVYSQAMRTYIADNKFINNSYIGVRCGHWYEAPETYGFNPTGSGCTAIIERNEFYWTPDFRRDQMQYSIYDGAQIYMGDSSSRILIRHNYIHDIGGLDDHYSGIYVDAGGENVDIYGNMIINVAGLSIYESYRGMDFSVNAFSATNYNANSSLPNTVGRPVLLRMDQCSGGCCIGNIVNSPILYNGRTLTVNKSSTNPGIYVSALESIPSNIEGANILLYQDLEVETKTDYTDNYITLDGIELPLRDIKILYQRTENGEIYMLRSLRDQLVYRLPWDPFVSQHIHSAISSSKVD